MTNTTRRNLLNIVGIGAIIPVVSLFKTSTASAADLPMVNAMSDQATALEYTLMSTVEGQTCSNCALYQGADADEKGACPLFSGSSVNAKARCKAWAAKP